MHVRCRSKENVGCVFTAHGVLHNKNTIEDFRAVDKVELLKNEGLRYWNAVRSGSCLQDPTLLCQFFVLSFAVSFISLYRFILLVFSDV